MSNGKEYVKPLNLHEDDAAFYARASSIIDAVSESLRWGAVPDHSTIRFKFSGRNADLSGEYWRIQGTDLFQPPEDLADLTIFIGQADGTGIVRAAQSNGRIYIRCLPNMKNSNAIGRALRSRTGRAWQALLHELVHFLDHHRRAIPNPTRDHEDQTAYFNSPTEFNAYFYNVAAPLLDLLTLATTAIEQARTEATRLGFDQGFPTVLKSLLRPAHKGPRAYVKLLSDRNRRALIKRLYGLYKAIADRL